VIAAFLLPIGVFVAALVAAQEALRGALESERIAAVAGFAIAVAVAVFFVFGMRWARRFLNR